MKKKIKAKHNTVSNVFYMLRVMFKISPGLVIGEIAEQIMGALPSKLISVIGLKYVIDEVQNGGDPKKIILAIASMLGIIIACEVFTNIFYELFAHREREKLDLGIQSMFYKKAAELDLARYDDPGYYSDFILSIENTADNLRSILNLVRGYVEQVIAFAAVAAIMLTIDPICLVIVLVSVILFIPVGKYTGSLQTKRREATTEKHRRADYFSRLFYLPDYAGEIRTSGVYPLLRKRFTESADDVIDTQRRYVKKLDWLFFAQEFTVQVVGFMLILSLYIGYQTIVTGNMSAGDFVATFNGSVQIGSAVLYLTVYSLRNFTERSQMIEKCREFLGETSKIKDGEHIAECGEPEKISVKNVTFAYEGSKKDCINNVSFEIMPGEKIALVGYNGAGKSTLTNLLLRLYDIKDGSIEIGGRDIREETV
ncbi:MAG: ABC transporter ATP-binding protein, partial [Acutalibacteraceae bacterium]|nr:ABC transporter ATP-binding protein [Acutalibacteraceae bacterium]